MSAIHVQEVVVTVLPSQVFGEICPQVFEQLSWRLLDLRAALIVGVREVMAIVADGEGLAIRKDELVFCEDTLDPARVLLRISVENSLSQFEELFALLLQQFYLKLCVVSPCFV